MLGPGPPYTKSDARLWRESAVIPTSLGSCGGSVAGRQLFFVLGDAPAQRLHEIGHPAPSGRRSEARAAVLRVLAQPSAATGVSVKSIMGATGIANRDNLDMMISPNASG